MKTLIAAVLAAISLITPTLAESGLKFQGTITFNQSVRACDDVISAGRHLMSTGMPGYPMGVCQRLPAGREWGVYKTEKLLSGYEAFCVVSMFIRQAPTDCLWTVVRPRDYVWSEP